MKKLVLLFALFTLSVNAQDIKGGFKVAPCMPSFSKDVDNDSSGKIGYSLGYFETMDVNSNFTLQGEINYTHISYEAKSYSYFGSSSDKTTYSSNFIEIPLIAKYKIDDFGIGGGFQFNWGLGSDNDMGYLLDASYDIDSFKIGARYFSGSGQNYNGNSLNNITVSFGYILF
jgi:hypothetical protein